MPRTTKESDEETETRPGRRTRGQTGPSVVDSPLRRSTRVRLHAKQNDSSPESPVSDTSNASTTRVTRRRGTMDTVSGVEKPRSLRSRKNSMSSEASEAMDVDIAPGTPTRSRTAVSKHLLRTGSDAKSLSGITRVTRRTRASSMGPDDTDGLKPSEKSQSKTTDVPVKTRRRASVLPSEATVVEEKEENALVVESNASLSEIIEDNESESKTTPNSTGKKESPMSSKSKSNTSRKRMDENSSEEDDTPVKGQRDKPAENISSDTSEILIQDTSISDAKTISYTEQKSLEISANSVSDVTISGHSIQNTSQPVRQTDNQEPSKELGLKIENLLNDSIEEREKSFNNKENQTGNIISDTTIERNTEPVLNVLTQSPKLISASPVLVNKSMKEKYRSVVSDASVTKRRCSKDASEAVVLLVNTSIDKEKVRNVDNNKELINISVDSPSRTVHNKSSDKTTPSIKLDAGSNLLDNSKPCDEMVTQDAIEADSSTINVEISSKENESMRSTDLEIDATDNDRENQMDISVSEGNEILSVDEDKTRENEAASQLATKYEVEQETATLDTSGNVKENEAVDATEKSSSSNLTETAVESTDVSVASNTQSFVLPDDERDDKESSDIEQANESLPSCVSAVPKISNVSVNPNKDKDDVVDVVKSSQSSIVTESSVERSEELSDKAELSQKTSIQDTSLTSRRKSKDNLKSKENEQGLEVDQEVQKQSGEKMEVDDNDSDVNAANLFQDIPADEWNSKSVVKVAESDDSSIYSMATERMELESEAEYDLVLVDREAWLAAENLKAVNEGEHFDYNSDDTTASYTHQDSLKATNDRRPAMAKLVEECEKSDDVEAPKTNSARKSLERKDVEEENKENDANDDETTENRNSINKSLRKDLSKSINESDQQGTPKLNKSPRKSLEKKLNNTKEIEDDARESFSDSKLNKSTSSQGNSIKRRKSMNKSILTLDSESSDDSVCNVSQTKTNKDKSDDEYKEEHTQEVQTEKKRKSLNKSQTKVNDAGEIVKCSPKNVMTHVNENDKNQSLNSSLKKQIKSARAGEESARDSDNESKDDEQSNTVRKKTFDRNYSTMVHVGSDCGDNRSNIDSDDSRTGNTTLPTFLFHLSDSETNDDDNDKRSNGSIDSDIRREYNLDGITDAKFSDDDVPGDECRASESESSDPDDDGADLKDFVVDDDEIEEEEIKSNDEIEVAEAKEETEADEEEEKVESEEEIDVGEDGGGMEEGENGGSAEEMEVEDDEEGAEFNEQEEEEGEVDAQVDESDTNDGEILNESLQSSKKLKDGTQKARFKLDSSLPRAAENGKKKKSKLNASPTSGNEMDSSLCNLSLSNSLKARYTSEEGKDSNEFVEDSMKMSKRFKKLHRSMECSTPKSTSSKREKFETSIQTLQGTDKKLGNQTMELETGTSIKEKGSPETSLRGDKSIKKLKKLEGKEASLMHKSLPTDLLEFVEGTNLSRPMSSKVTELNRTTATPSTETPTTKYLRKDKLNESAPALQLTHEHKKLMKRNLKKEQTVLSMESQNEEATVDESCPATTEEEDELLKRKLCKVAESILDIDRQKKSKKRKRPQVENGNASLFDEGDLQENVRHVKKKEKHAASAVAIDTNASSETCESTEKKKKKKKKKKEGKEKIETEIEEAAMAVELSPSLLSKEESEVCVEPIQNKKKKKKKKEGKEKVETEIEEAAMAVEVSPSLLSKEESEVCDEPIQNKKKKKKKKGKDKSQDLSECTSTDADNLVSVGETLKTKKASAQTEEVSRKKLKKNELAKDIPSKVKPEPKKAVRLMEHVNDNASNSDETSEAVAFSKIRGKAQTILEHAADSIKVTKEMKKKKRKEHLEKMQKEEEAEVHKIESKRQLNTVVKTPELRKGVKRLSYEVIENLPEKPAKRRKLFQKEEQTLPSRPMLNPRAYDVKNVEVQDNYIELSSRGGTTAFGVVNLQKIKKQKSMPKVHTFRQRMLARNARQPVSAYLMHLERQKASSKAKPF